MRRVLIFSVAYFPLVGGAEVAVREITDRQTDWQFDLVCARLRPGLSSSEKIGNVTVHRVGFGMTFDKFLFPVLGAWRAFRLRGPRESFVWSILASYAGYAAVVYSWIRPSSKVLLTLQEGDPFEQYVQRAGILGFTRRWIFQRANAVQVISRFLGDWAKQMGFKGEPQVVPNGVDVARFTRRISSERRTELRRQFGFGESDVVFVTTGRLTRKNAVDDLIRSLKMLPANYRVLSIGDGEDREMLERLVTENGLAERVVLLGKRGHDELPELLQSADIFVRPSLSEGLGNSFLEAMAAGLPIIGTPVGGIPDFLVDGETGVFCQPRDPQSITDAASRLTSSGELYQSIAQKGERLVRAQYDWDDVARRMNAVFQRV